MERPAKCPICGSKIMKVTNITTKNSYYKCSNKTCTFVLGDTYTDAEYYLQGQKLETTCLKCKTPLTIANGPHGLYPRCFNCDCDLTPKSYNGKIYPKWVNAHRDRVKEELEALIESFNSKNSEDELYDFDIYISTQTPKTIKAERVVKNVEEVSEEPIKKKQEKSTKRAYHRKHSPETIASRLLTFLVDNPEPYSALELSKKMNLHVGSVRPALVQLCELNLIKVVKCEPTSVSSCELYYQTVDSKIPAVKIYTKEDGYSTILSFAKDNIDLYGAAQITRMKLMNMVADGGIKPEYVRSTRGVFLGLPISKMHDMMTNGEKTETPKKAEVEETVAPKRKRKEFQCNSMKNRILEVMKNDMSHPYTVVELAQVFNVDKSYVKTAVKKLRNDKKLKIVGWEYKEDCCGASALKYQVAESPMPRCKITTNNNAYLTFKQFYEKKIKGNKDLSVAVVKQVVKSLPMTPLLINQRAYAGYSVSDLREALNKLKTGETPVPKRARAKSSMPLEVEAATMISNPIVKKKSLLSKITSLFRKEEVLS